MNSTYKIVTSFITVCFLLTGCRQHSRLDFALSVAGENRAELETVLQHYAADSLKRAAAEFLIEQMPYRYGLEGTELENLHSFYRAASTSGLNPKQVCDSMQGAGYSFSKSRMTPVRDIESIRADFLIAHIDKAFEIWRQQPWGRHISFDTFCRHILPYRVGNEKLKPWIEDMHARFDPLLDSIRATPDSADILKVTETLVDGLRKLKRNYGHGLPSGVSIGPDNTEWLAGDCREFTDIQTYIMRSVGLPGGCDKMPITGNYFLPHFWNYVIDGNGETYYCSMLFKTPELVKADKYPGPKGKVMREDFAVNEGILDRIESETSMNEIHPAFRYFTDSDVTPVYSGDSIKDIRIPIDKCGIKLKKGEPVYACLSSHLDWIPVDMAWKDGDAILLRDIDGDVVMRLGVYRDGELQMTSNPFFISKKTGEERFFDPSEEKEEICLLYKFDDIFREGFSKGMLGGVMEGSDYADFRKKDTLHFISESPKRLYTRVRSRSDRPYRYVRYYGPDGGKCYASEVTFIGHRPGETQNEVLSGEWIGTPNLHSENKYPFTNVVDGDPYTSFVYEKVSGGWVGLALHEPMIVDTIVYTPRNRRNFIEDGDDYELFYCDGDWKSLGRKRADSDSLLFQAPQGALLYLKNHSRGNQERIFEYWDGRQIFY